MLRQSILYKYDYNNLPQTKAVCFLVIVVVYFENLSHVSLNSSSRIQHQYLIKNHCEVCILHSIKNSYSMTVKTRKSKLHFHYSKSLHWNE